MYAYRASVPHTYTFGRMVGVMSLGGSGKEEAYINISKRNNEVSWSTYKA